MHPYTKTFKANLQTELQTGQEALRLIPSEINIEQPARMVSLFCEGDPEGNLIRLLRSKGYTLRHINFNHTVVLSYERKVYLHVTLPPYSPALLELGNELYLKELDKNA